VSEHEAESLKDGALLADDSESLLSEIADWGPAEDWSDWADATG